MRYGSYKTRKLRKYRDLTEEEFLKFIQDNNIKTRRRLCEVSFSMYRFVKETHLEWFDKYLPSDKTAKKIICVELNKVFNSTYKAAEFCEVSHSFMRKLLKKKVKYKNMTWEYFNS